MDTAETLRIDGSSPLLLMAALFEARGWQCRLDGAEEMAGEVQAAWGRYVLRFIRRAGDHVLQGICQPGITVPMERAEAIARLVALANERVWFGHFEFWSRSGVLAYRSSVLLSDEGEITLAQAQRVTETAIEECDRFFPAFQFALWSEKSPEEALAAAMIDAAGAA
ncbi:hypothetical protein EYB45_11045 [Erythrobacteraceae bacterium CFH 75059]|uniref:YbjN domain-containing protein n=1 Tax=Qipengyuania thermophila TaxID=2509361 RepID=UPI001022911B|nr:YbjN domain-containing protein [Qipengyuania thermophila]TCD00651.1 hypothetical protein EYB45_11045 [Erythrobacteraceae bacterium CFH 75059]